MVKVWKILNYQTNRIKLLKFSNGKDKGKFNIIDSNIGVYKQTVEKNKGQN